MGLVTKPFTFSPGTTIQSAQVNADFDTIYGDYNGNIDGNNISSITESKTSYSGTGHAHSGGAGGAPVQLVVGTPITSAATITIPTDGNTFRVDGTTGITAINARTAGVLAILRFAGALVLTHNAVSLILLDGQNVLTAAGDIVALMSEGGGNWREIWRSRPVAYGNYRVEGLLGANNGAAPTTKFDVTADMVVFRHPTTGETVTKKTVTLLSCDVSAAGPAINARDQAGAFGASSWIHFYYIYNLKTDTIATIASATAPPTGPTLPTDYTHWAYIGAVRFSGASALVVTYARGKVFAAVSTSVLAGGATSTEQTVSLTAVVPPNALTALLQVYGTLGSGENVNLRLATGVDFRKIVDNTAGITSTFNTPAEIPNVGQNVFVKTSTANAISVDGVGYTVPNGE